ncbi:unnamed protein product [Colias eurytheme]|nr:unnamed protein product [Colias eurytheme]
MSTSATQSGHWQRKCYRFSMLYARVHLYCKSDSVFGRKFECWREPCVVRTFSVRCGCVREERCAACDCGHFCSRDILCPPGRMFVITVAPQYRDLLRANTALVQPT